MDCTPHDVATGETHLQGVKMEVVATSENDLKGQKLEVVATGETDLMCQQSHVVATGEIDLEAREEIAGRVMSAWMELRGAGAVFVVYGGTWLSGGRAGRNDEI